MQTVVPRRPADGVPVHTGSGTFRRAAGGHRPGTLGRQDLFASRSLLRSGGTRSRVNTWISHYRTEAERAARVVGAATLADAQSGARRRARNRRQGTLKRPTGRHLDRSAGRIFITPEAFADMDAWHATAAEIRDEPVKRAEAEGWTRSGPSPSTQTCSRCRSQRHLLQHREVGAGPDLQYDMSRPSALSCPAPWCTSTATCTTSCARSPTTGARCGPSPTDHQSPSHEFVDRDRRPRRGLRRGRRPALHHPGDHEHLRGSQSDEPLMLSLTQGLLRRRGSRAHGRLRTRWRPSPRRSTASRSTSTPQRRAAREPTDDLATVIANGMVDGAPMGIERLWYYIIVAHRRTRHHVVRPSGGSERLLAHPTSCGRSRTTRRSPGRRPRR